METFQKKSVRTLLILLAAFALLVAPHEGEFWPFSIYPMFSKAGKPWSRAVVRDVTNVPDSLRWQVTDLDNLNGSPVALREYGVDAIDFANFVSKTKEWDLERRLALQTMFGKEQLGDREFMVLKVTGQLEGDDSVTTKAYPMMLVSAKTVSPNAAIVMN